LQSYTFPQLLALLFLAFWAVSQIQVRDASINKLHFAMFSHFHFDSVQAHPAQDGSMLTRVQLQLDCD
jgi:hypothetical protein